MASCMECIHFNPCNEHARIIIKKPTSGQLALSNKVEKECKHFLNNADVSEVKHGYDKQRASSMFECSLCGFKDSNIYESDTGRFYYCPYCGAMIDGKENDIVNKFMGTR